MGLFSFFEKKKVQPQDAEPVPLEKKNIQLVSKDAQDFLDCHLRIKDYAFYSDALDRTTALLEKYEDKPLSSIPDSVRVKMSAIGAELRERTGIDGAYYVYLALVRKAPNHAKYYLDCLIP